jgi:hypothetical protein
MTSHRFKRCVHCGLVYAWQSSGYGCHNPVNDQKYCPDCKAAIVKALENIPVRFRSVWVETKDISVETLLKHRERTLEKAKKDNPNRIIGERVVAPLFDMVDSENIYCGLIVSYQGEDYLVETWSKTPQENTVKVKMEENLITGKRMPWRNV